MKRYLLIVPAFLVLGVSVVTACNYLPEPSSTPAPTTIPTETSVETPISEEPTAIPARTDSPNMSFSEPSPAYAPTQATCPAIEGWIPTVSYHGSTLDPNGNSVFHYTWTTVDKNIHTYKVEYGFTKEFLPYNIIVSGETVDITMYGGRSNWMRVQAYAEPGCGGMWSEVTN